MDKRDLNKLKIQTDSGEQVLLDNSASSANGDISVYFRDIEQKLLAHINAADLVVGCVAWLTSETILSALSNVKDGVALVVQKEDFLRPDVGSDPNWRRKLRSTYDRLKVVPERHLWGGLFGSLSVACHPVVAPVRCVGNHNRDKKPAFPRMHHKFLVFCKSGERDEYGVWRHAPEPFEVWTGSFNLTKNAGFSFENAVVIKSPEIVRAYFAEWQQIEALSEPLDWSSDWVEPEWRIGT